VIICSLLKHDEQVDFYSLCVLLCECAARRFPSSSHVLDVSKVLENNIVVEDALFEDFV
jgi:hypothetical protein